MAKTSNRSPLRRGCALCSACCAASCRRRLRAVGRGCLSRRFTTGRDLSWAPGVRVWLRVARHALLEPVGRWSRRLSHRVGAGNSAVVVDLPRWGPMLSPRVPNLVPIPGPRKERETPGQRPRPNYGHPHAGTTLPTAASPTSAATSISRSDRPRRPTPASPLQEAPPWLNTPRAGSANAAQRYRQPIDAN